MSSQTRLLVVISTIIAATLLVSCSVAMAGTFPVVICGSSLRDPGDGLSWSANAPLIATAQCPYNGPGLELYSPTNKTVGKNATAAFQATAPAGIAVYSIHVVNAYSSGIGTGGWWGEFYWNGGPGPAGRSGPLSDAQFNSGGCCSQTNLGSRTIGWFIACNQSSCSSGTAGRVRGMAELDLVGEEDQAPTIIASGGDNLWYQGGWVRGRWPVSFTASDPSGVCGAAVVFGSLPAILTATPDTAPNRHTWQQCPQQSVPAAVDTSASDGSLGRGDGTMQLRLTATNTAGVTANPTKTVYVDNSTPTVSLGGPVDAPSTAGTQYVAATAGGSPSGIADIVCTVDGGPAETFASASAHVPVSGVGPHTVGCFAEDNAVDPSGAHGRSTTASWSLKIGQPTEMGIAFDKLVGLRCHSARVRVTIPGHWITARRHGKRVKVKTRARSKLERVQRCHPRTVRRRTVVFVRARRHGHLVKLKRVKYVRVVVPPHLVAKTARLVPFGHGTTVNGWLGTSSGTALAGQVVHVLTAPNNGSNAFTEAGTVTTTATGFWTAQLPPGPSRVVEAVFDGSPTTESSSSGQVRVKVPAMVRIAIRPRIVPWGSEIHVTGRVLGGYVPANSNLLRLNVGIGRIGHIEGLPDIRPDGRFLIVWKFDRGQGVIHPWFSVGTLSEAAFPYAPGTSKRVIVTLGERTPVAAATHHRGNRHNVKRKKRATKR
jgi:hypothetical protein